MTRTETIRYTSAREIDVYNGFPCVLNPLVIGKKE